MHILFTKTELDTPYLANKFIQLGHRVSVFPILQVEKIKVQKINFDNYNSLIFTSSNAVACIDQEISQNLKNVRCFCVGPATAEYAKKKGFLNIVTAGGSYHQLKETILNLSDKNDGKFLYLRGEFISNDLKKDLMKEGYQVDSLINYTTNLNTNFDTKTLKIFNEQLVNLVFVYSKRSAEQFVKIILNNDLQLKCSSIKLRCVSENVLTPLHKIKWMDVKLFFPGNEEFCLD